MFSLRALVRGNPARTKFVAENSQWVDPWVSLYSKSWPIFIWWQWSSPDHWLLILSVWCSSPREPHALAWGPSSRVGVNSIPELELQLNSNSNSGIGIGIGIEISGIESGIGIEIPGIGVGIGIENRNWIFLQLLPQHLLVNQPFPNFSFKRGGHNLSCDWLLMQQVCLLSSWDIAPCGVVTKDHGEGTLFSLSGQRPEGLKMVTINISAYYHDTQKNYYHCWIKELFQGLWWNYPNIQVSLSSYCLAS